MRHHKSSITFISKSGDYLVVVRERNSFWYTTKEGKTETTQMLSFIGIIQFVIEWISKHKALTIVPID